MQTDSTICAERIEGMMVAVAGADMFARESSIRVRVLFRQQHKLAPCANSMWLTYTCYSGDMPLACRIVVVSLHQEDEWKIKV